MGDVEQEHLDELVHLQGTALVKGEVGSQVGDSLPVEVVEVKVQVILGQQVVVEPTVPQDAVDEAVSLRHIEEYYRIPMNTTTSEEKPTRSQKPVKTVKEELPS